MKTDEMTDDEMRAKIAELCGFPTPIYGPMEIQYGGQNNGTYIGSIPDYLNDLNAMHEAEKTLTDDEFAQYEVWLGNIGAPGTSLGNLIRQRAKVYATARQRAIAFLKTKLA